jgi:diguanylate cyclase (GGDEF)-like protein
VVDCDGFSSLDESYGSGAGDHVFKLLHRALKVETRDSDLVVRAQDQELILILEGSSPEVAKSVMQRVERRFAGWLTDAGYECNLSVGLANMDEDEAEFEALMRSARRSESEPYLD